MNNKQNILNDQIFQLENDKPHQLDGYTAIKVSMKSMLNCQTIQNLHSKNSIKENNQFTCVQELELYKSVHTHTESA